MAIQEYTNNTVQEATIDVVPMSKLVDYRDRMRAGVDELRLKVAQMHESLARTEGALEVLNALIEGRELE